MNSVNDEVPKAGPVLRQSSRPFLVSMAKQSNSEGFIKLHRKILDWEWAQKPNTFLVFLWLLLNANWKDSRWQGHEVKRGQIITGRKAIAEATHLSEQSVRTALSHLISTREITKESPTNQWSRITIIKFDNYQLTKEPTKDQPRTNQGLTTIEEGKKGRREERKKRRKRESGEKKFSPTPAEKARDFFNLVGNPETDMERYQCLLASISGRMNLPVEIVRRELDKFTNYWCERTKSGKQQLWETKKTFEVQRRFLTWIRNYEKFGEKRSSGGVFIS